MKPDLTPQMDEIGSAAMAADAVTDVWDELDGIDPNEWPEWAEAIYTMVDDAMENLRKAREEIESYAADEANGTFTYDMDGAHQIEQEEDDG